MCSIGLHSESGLVSSVACMTRRGECDNIRSSHSVTLANRFIDNHAMKIGHKQTQQSFFREMPQTLLSSDKDSIKDSKHEEDKQEENKLLYKGAFDEFDWNKNGTIPTRVNF